MNVWDSVETDASMVDESASVAAVRALAVSLFGGAVFWAVALAILLS